MGASCFYCAVKRKLPPASRRKKLDTSLGVHRSEILLVAGPQPYINWECDHCIGNVKDEDVIRLRDLCNEVLERRTMET
jgi:hypothetical protein